MEAKKLNKLIQTKKKVAQKFIGKGLSGIDVGYKISDGEMTDEITIRFHVPKKMKERQLKKSEMLPRNIGKVKTDVLENKFELLTTVTTVNASDVLLSNDNQRYDVLRGGIGIGPSEPKFVTRDDQGNIFSASYETGTLGAIVIDNYTKKEVLLTNNHVLSIDGEFREGLGVCQPPTGFLSDRIATNLRNDKSFAIDGAIGLLNNSRPYVNEIQDIGSIMGKDMVQLNEAVRKRGRTTLLTEGIVDGIAGTFGVSTSRGIVDYQDVFSIRSKTNSPFSSHGDSGSVIVNSQNKLVGLLFAGTPDYTLAMPINNVLNKLNLSLIVDDFTTNIDDYPLLKLGFRGKYVKEMQEILNKGLDINLVTDGIFGRKSLAAVLKFQEINGLTQDGVVGPQTWSKLLLI